jgi:hypothetical protein
MEQVSGTKFKSKGVQKIAFNSYVTQILFVLRMRLIHYSKRSKFNRKLMMITGKKEIDGGIKF